MQNTATGRENQLQGPVGIVCTRYSLQLTMPATAIGAHFYTQYACLDVSANGLGVTVSNYGRVLVGF